MSVDSFVKKAERLSLFTDEFLEYCKTYNTNHIDVCKTIMNRILRGSKINIKGLPLYEEDTSSSKHYREPIDFLSGILQLNIDWLKNEGKLFDCFVLINAQAFGRRSCLAEKRKKMSKELCKEVKEFVELVYQRGNEKLWKRRGDTIHCRPYYFRKVLNHLVGGVIEEPEGVLSFLAKYPSSPTERIIQFLETYFYLLDLKNDKNFSKFSWMPWNICNGYVMSSDNKNLGDEDKSTFRGCLFIESLFK